ncbi:MAG: nucleoside hydrolase [Cyanophyceae cyanobacterium]
MPTFPALPPILLMSPTSPARDVIIDCDPGVDDAIALLLALASPELRILGITTVAGNVPLALTQRNARQICELAGQTGIPVFAGCARPLVRSLLTTAEAVHGKTGLEGVMLPDPQMPLQAQHGVDFLVETLMGSPTPITIAATGPLTNIAMALVKQPRIVEKIAALVVMGGSVGPGNVTAAAEFNAYVDPHAAHVVFASGLPLTMFGLNLTHQVVTTARRRQRIEALGSRVSQAVAALLARYGSHDSDQFGLAGGPLHDPCVIGYLLQPDLFQLESAQVEVEIASPLTMGQTVVDRRDPQGSLTKVAIHADADGFFELLTERLSRYTD